MVTGMAVAGLTAVLLAANGGTAAADCDGTRAQGTFAPPGATVPSDAKTYDMELVPAGARIEVRQHTGKHGTVVKLRVGGLKADYAYGAHVHQKPCGTDPAAAGGHYQNEVDPVQPSKDPRYLNAENEIWLDFTTDKAGNGEAAARHGWNFRPGGAASVVLHREQGGAGDRLACFTVPFAPRPPA
ncbi:superoxide dismutase family protein [Streptomyces sp. NPDC050418]|uniref:superoxide dismutase family protein n=1 Tax=Streptomyces sp. NPDC050418 TaxID=3365612 RepID=UPI0037B33138